MSEMKRARRVLTLVEGCPETEWEDEHFLARALLAKQEECEGITKALQTIAEGFTPGDPSNRETDPRAGFYRGVAQEAIDRARKQGGGG